MAAGRVLTVVGTVALDTLAEVKQLAQPEHTGGVLRIQADLPGGTGGNVAMALARLGAPPRLVSSVGRDFAGSAYERALREAGVGLDGLDASGGEPTARAYVFYEASGRQSTYFFPGARWRLPPDVAEGARLHFCAGDIACYPSLMERAAWVSFDPGQEVFHRDLDQIVACLSHVDLLFLNHHERAMLESRAGLSLPKLLDEGVEAVVETLGRDGTVVHTPRGRFAAPSVPVHVRDPTGAGDAHRAGFLYAMDRGADLGVAARFASVLASFAIEHVGAQTGHPTLEQAVARHEKEFRERPFG